MQKAIGTIWCVLAYAAGLAAAFYVGAVLEGQHPLVVIGAADAAGTVVVFLFSAASNNSSVYDPYWSAAPIVIFAYLAYLAGPEADDLTRLLVMGLFVVLWGVRLTWNWYRGWNGLAQEDWRYVDIREKTGWGYWPVSFLGIHLVPTIFVYLGCFSMYAALMGEPRPFNYLDIFASAVTAFAIWIEATADNQLRAFKRANRQSGKILDTGVWAWCRHPNYLGEILFWWGLYGFALAADWNNWWTIVGPLAITLLFVFISLPLIEKRMAKKPGYAAHRKASPALLPRPWRRSSSRRSPLSR